MKHLNSKVVVRTVQLLLLAGFLIAVTVFFLYLNQFRGDFSSKQEVWGTFGDFIGGTLNPILSFFALIALLLTLVLQSNQLEISSKALDISRTELALTREEVARSADALSSQDKNLYMQRFENTFFRLLEHLNTCRNNISYGYKENTKNGIDAIEKIYNSFTSHHLQVVVGRTGTFPKYSFKESCKEKNGLIEEYSKFYTGKHGDDLGQYFRVLYHLLKFVDRSAHVGDKYFYTHLIRAQLSRYELCLIFYNSLSSYGDKRMSPLVKKYNLLKHLEEDKIPEENRFLMQDFIKINN